MISLQHEIEAAEHAHERALERIEELWRMEVIDQRTYEALQRDAAANHEAAVQFAHLWRDVEAA